MRDIYCEANDNRMNSKMVCSHREVANGAAIQHCVKQKCPRVLAAPIFFSFFSLSFYCCRHIFSLMFSPFIPFRGVRTLERRRHPSERLQPFLCLNELPTDGRTKWMFF